LGEAIRLRNAEVESERPTFVSVGVSLWLLFEERALFGIA